MTNTDQSCADRIQDSWAKIEQQLHMMLFPNNYSHDQLENAEINPADPMESFSEYGLAFDYVEPDTFDDQPTGYFRYQISWGGPSEEIRFFTDARLNLDRAEFHYLDWFDGACLDVTENPSARAVFDFFSEIDALQAELDQ